MPKTFPKGGVHPPENKLTATHKIEVLPSPKIAYIPIIQHIGAPSTVIVKKGEDVKVGQIIAKSSGFVSANIHASVSGKILKIDETLDTSGYKRMAVHIEVAGDEWMPEIDNSTTLIKDINISAEEIISKVAQAGIVGLGGATFPSHVKLSVPKGKKCEYFIINGVECEPYLTSDHRLMLEKSEEIMVGIQIIMKALNVSKAIIGIENNKPDAIEKMTQLANSYPGVTVEALKVQYPQGGEKQLIKAVINREVPSGGLPIDVGCVVHNVGTIIAIYEAVQKNKPLFQSVVTVTGKSVKKPSNFLVRVGTPIRDLIEAAGGLPEDTGKIINGGPMMGKAVYSLDVPVAKGTSAVLILPQDEVKRRPMSSCIRCAKCVSACPMGLEPYLLMVAAEMENWERTEAENVMDCIECGSCSYTCPADRPLLDYIRLGKSTVSKIIRARKN